MTAQQRPVSCSDWLQFVCHSPRHLVELLSTTVSKWFAPQVCNVRWENLDRFQCRYQPIKFANLVVPSPCETEQYKWKWHQNGSGWNLIKDKGIQTVICFFFSLLLAMLFWIDAREAEPFCRDFKFTFALLTSQRIGYIFWCENESSTLANRNF